MPSVPQILEAPAVIASPLIEEDITLALEGENLGLRGTSIFEGPERDSALIGNEAIFVLETSGEQDPMIGGLDAGDLQDILVQIVVRSEKEDFAGGKRRAAAVMEALHKKHPARYVSWTCSTPFYFKRDEKNRHFWSITLTALHFQ